MRKAAVGLASGRVWAASAADGKPGNAARDETEGERCEGECNPSGLRVKSSQGDGGSAGVADEEQDGDAHDVQQVNEHHAGGQEQETLREPGLFAEQDQPDDAESEDEAHAFEAGTSGGDFDLERTGADHEVSGIEDHRGYQKAQEGGHKSVGKPGQRRPEGVRSVGGKGESGGGGH